MHDAAIRHAVVAIGALHEHTLRLQASRHNLETAGLHPFALRQCNKAIKQLLRPSSASLIRATTAAILFAYFENMQGSREAAVPHVLYARRLAVRQRQHSSKDLTTASPWPIRLDEVEPLLSHLEIQLRDKQSEDMPPGTGRELDLSAPLHFHSIAPARVTLEKLIAQWRELVVSLPSSPTQYHIDEVAATRALYADWLRRWDVAFTQYLTLHGHTLDAITMTGCRILKAHQVAALVLTEVDYTLGEAAWDRCTALFKIVVELCSAAVGDMPTRLTSQVPQTAYLSLGMGMTEPLYAAATRCTDTETAARAWSLLHRLPKNEGAFSAWRTSNIEALLCLATGKDCDATQSSSR